MVGVIKMLSFIQLRIISRKSSSRATVLSGYQPKISKQIPVCVACKYFSSQIENQTANNLDQQDKFHEIFRFPMIKAGYYLHKLKWQQTLLAGAVVPIATMSWYVGMINNGWYICILYSCGIIVGNLYSVSSLFDKAVGFMYLSEDGSILKISYLDFWGNRVDEEYSVQDVTPFCDTPRSITDYLFKKMLFYSTDKLQPKLFLKFGVITDKEKFLKVFGSFGDQGIF